MVFLLLVITLNEVKLKCQVRVYAGGGVDFRGQSRMDTLKYRCLKTVCCMVCSVKGMVRVWL